ncbi:transglycosylase SLT domain-containing protein [Thiofilum flexile]|uniref:transglycosylase SLT domain-containing protein n=1 Tax=Thiofilum flexile TaxID=125627 RepID=UPI0013A599B7|nr:transglycosylase SLT domain-containing protein [Thiofilum flexile]
MPARFNALLIRALTSVVVSLGTSTNSFAYELAQGYAPNRAPAVFVQKANFNPYTARNTPAEAYYQSSSIWQRIGRSYQLGDHTINPSVQYFIRQYTANPQRIQALALNASRYLHIVIEEVERRGMPAEIALLPLVESGFTADAASHAGAAGLWQFMPKTGHSYGLIRNQFYDGRLDSFAATGAALNYLQELNQQFNGDWMLALAAYNAGPNRVRSALWPLQRSGQRLSYWKLSLPKETAQYVPRLLAFKEIISHPERYGIRLPHVPDAPILAQMRINKPIDLRQAALQAGLPAHTLTYLNPYFRYGVVTPEFSNRIILPRQQAAALATIIQALPPVYSGRLVMNR